MSDVAAIDGITGPGRRTILVLGEVNEITFRLKKKVVEVVGRDGNTGFYDLAQVNTVQLTSDGKDLTIAITSKVDEEKESDRTAEVASSSSSNKTAKPTA